MPRIGMRTIPHARTAIAAIILAFAGCFAAAAPARAASSLSLVILPDQGENAIYNFVNSAASSIDVTIYELKDTTLVNDPVARETAGGPSPARASPVQRHLLLAAEVTNLLGLVAR